MTETTFAKATGRNLAISTKSSIMICALLRKKKLSAAKRILAAVMEKKEAIPHTRFTDGVGHRKGIPASGRYPYKASKEILALLKSAEANAVDKGLTGELKITGLSANKASSPMKHGRQSRREAKRTHVYVTLEEIPGTKKAPAKKKKKSALADKLAAAKATPAKPAEKADPAGKQAAKKSTEKPAKPATSQS